MISLHQPSPDDVESMWQSAKVGEVAYESPGMTRSRRCPPGWVYTGGRVQLGKGEAVFNKARSAMLRWSHIPTDWIRLYPERPPLVERETICVCTRQWGFSTVNIDRIVYVDDVKSDDGARTFAYGWGTLDNHVERGEERFEIAHTVDGDVFYEIYSYSRPGHWATWLGYPVTRYFQRRFVRDSLRRLLEGDALE